MADAERRVAADPGLVLAEWQVVEVAPLRVEFWQGRADRAHTRLVYRSVDGAWERGARLAEAPRGAALGQHVRPYVGGARRDPVQHPLERPAPDGDRPQPAQPDRREENASHTSTVAS